RTGVCLFPTRRSSDLGYQFVIAGAPGFSKSFYQHFFGENEIAVVFNKTYDLLKESHAAVVASGTATLETALFHVPQVVVYKANTDRKRTRLNSSHVKS